MSRPLKIEDWQIEAAEYMARTGSTLQEAATAVGKQIPSSEIDNILRRKSFCQALAEAKNRFFIQLATSPTWKKDTAIGMLMADGEKLREQQSYDKAAECVFKAAKMAGWVGVEGQVNVFGELTQKDLDKIREDLTRVKSNVASQRPN
jgi:hypothetical protein